MPRRRTRPLPRHRTHVPGAGHPVRSGAGSPALLGGALEQHKSPLKTIRVGSFGRTSGHGDRSPVEALKALTQHWPVPVLAELAGDVDHPVRVDTEQIAVIGEVMD